jgi:hypothetical protein
MDDALLFQWGQAAGRAISTSLRCFACKRKLHTTNGGAATGIYKAPSGPKNRVRDLSPWVEARRRPAIVI